MNWQRLIFTIVQVATLGFPLFAQSAAWQQSDVKDPFRGTAFLQFKLVGKFLTPPKHAESDPALVVHCLPGKRMRVFNGRFLNGYVVIGTVLDSTVVEREGLLTGTTFATAIPVQYRLDDGKIQAEQWSPSTDHSAAFFPGPTLYNLLYGHFSPHKEQSSPPVRKIVVAMDEYLGGEIVMQFDMPDPTQLADVCGVLLRNKK